MKPLRFVGSSRDDLRAFPAAVRQAIGEELARVQWGYAPLDCKPMPSVGIGAYEVRVHIGGAWRAIYVAKRADAIYVLHAFRKKTQKTSRTDIELAIHRYRLLRTIP